MAGAILSPHTGSAHRGMGGVERWTQAWKDGEIQRGTGEEVPASRVSSGVCVVPSRAEQQPEKPHHGLRALGVRGGGAASSEKAWSQP